MILPVLGYLYPVTLIQPQKSLRRLRMVCVPDNFFFLQLRAALYHLPERFFYITEHGNIEAKEMTSAACFLLDNLYAKEEAGPELSLLAAADLGKAYSPTHLMDKATEMRVFMSGEDFSLGQSPVRDYIRFVAIDEDEVHRIKELVDKNEYQCVVREGD